MSEPSRRRDRHRSAVRRFLPLGITLAAITVGTIITVRLISVFPFTPEDLIVAEQPRHADAVVVLEGGRDRIPRALDLLEQGYAHTLIYPGAYASAERQLYVQTESRGLDYELIIDRNAASTHDEARRTASILSARPEITSILLVTSAYHSFRALWTFDRVLPDGIEVISVPSLDGSWRAARAEFEGTWHRTTFREEQIKFLGYFLIYGWLYR